MAGAKKVSQSQCGENFSAGGNRFKKKTAAVPTGKMMVVETTIDDMTGEFLGKDFQDAILDAGAADIFFTPVQMKKGRSGLNITVIVSQEKLPVLIDFLLENTTTIGLRYYEVARNVLERKIVEVNTPYGKVPIKEVVKPSGRKSRKFEYESLRELSEKSHISINQLQQELYHLLTQEL
ncbi:MAG: nickel insertion protein [Bacteroidia bacterium]